MAILLVGGCPVIPIGLVHGTYRTHLARRGATWRWRPIPKAAVAAGWWWILMQADE